jgi:hypothetical protein
MMTKAENFLVQMKLLIKDIKNEDVEGLRRKFKKII